MNPVRRALLDRSPTLGSWIQMGHAAVAEVLAHAGFDWIAIDCEHTDIDIAGATGILRGMHGRGVVPFVRVRENDTLAIRQVLDAGASGVIVPLIHDAAAAEAAVQAAKYPPRGVRGYAYSRMNDHGARFDDYAATANDEIAVVAMIESRQAVANIAEILAVDGIDGVFVGPYDLSGSYGVPGQVDAPDVVAGQQRVLDACAAAGKSAGLHLVRPTAASVRETLERGFTFVALGVDVVFLAEGAGAALDAARTGHSQGSVQEGPIVASPRDSGPDFDSAK